MIGIEDAPDWLLLFSKKNSLDVVEGTENLRMDSIVYVMIGSLLCVTTALTFMEVRKIRKRLEKTPN